MQKNVLERTGAGNRRLPVTPRETLGERNIRTHTITGGGGLRLAVHEYGQPDGKPILFIHGFSQCHLVWSRQYHSSLADEFRLVCLDNRGHGMSEKPVEGNQYTQADLWADDLQAIMTELGLHKPILVGWSYGGFVINDYIAKYGQSNVGGINYVCAAVLLGSEKAAPMIGRGFTDYVPGLCSENLEDNLRAVGPFVRGFFETEPGPEEFEILVTLTMAVPPAVRLGLVSRVIDRDAVLQRLTVPALITQGEKDRLVLASNTAHLLSCIPHAQASVYSDIGHAPFIENPGRFNSELAAFARQSCR